MDNCKGKEEHTSSVEILFSPQEVAIGAELLRNPSYKEIARKTSMSPKMVAYYMSTMMKKTRTSSKKELAAFFRKGDGGGRGYLFFSKKILRIAFYVTIIKNSFGLFL